MRKACTCYRFLECRLLEGKEARCPKLACPIGKREESSKFGSGIVAAYVVVHGAISDDFNYAGSVSGN